jgi:hypothetical protein
MIRRKISMRSQAVAAVLAGFVMVIGAECVGAASHHDTFDSDLTGTVDQPAIFGPAELDPVFQQKLLQRIRGRYERAHPLDLPTPQSGKI